MDLFTYLMAKNGNNTSIHEDLFSYLLGKAQGGGGEIKTATGITINIPDAKKLVSFMMTKESTQDGEPTPDNPVEVKTVKGSVDVKVVGKNLFDKNNIQWYRANSVDFSTTINTSDIRIRTNSFKIEGGKTYVVSGIPDEVTLYRVRTYNEYNGENIASISLTNNSFTLDSQVKYIHLFFIGSNFTDETNTLMANANIQIEEGSTATTYEPYKETIVPIPLNNNELVGIGDYKDELKVDKSGHVFINKKTKKYIFDGTENWKHETLSGGRSNFYLSTLTRGIKKAGMFNNIGKFNNGTLSNNYNCYVNTTVLNYLCNEYTNVNDFKNMISNQNMIIYYVLETPELIDLQTTVDLKLFKGVNNVSNSEDGYMTIEYK